MRGKKGHFITIRQSFFYHSNCKYEVTFINHLNLTEIYQTLNQTSAEYTFFPNADETFTNLDHMMGHNTSHNKFPKIKCLQIMVSDCKNKVMIKICVYIYIKLPI